MPRTVYIDDVPPDYLDSDLFYELKEQAEEHGEDTIPIEDMPFRTRDFYPSGYSFVSDAGDIVTETINDHELFMTYLEHYRFWGFRQFHVEFLVHYIYFEQDKSQIIDDFPELKILKIFENFDASCTEKTKMKCIAAKEFGLINQIDALTKFCNINKNRLCLALSIMIMNGDEEVFENDEQYLVSIFELGQWRSILDVSVNFNLVRYAFNINVYSWDNTSIDYTIVYDKGAKNIQTIQGKINEQIYEFVDKSRFAKDPIETVKRLKETNVAFDMAALAWTAVGNHPKCMAYIIENMPDVDKNFKLCNIAAINDNVECVDIAKNAGFDPYVDFDALLENDNLACLKYCIINNLINIYEWDYLHSPSKEALILIHKHGIEIPRYFIVKTIEIVKSFKEYFEFFEQVGFTFASGDYEYILSNKNIVNMHKKLRVPFSSENSRHFCDLCWEDKDLNNLKYIDSHGGINWNDFKAYVERYRYVEPSRTLIVYAIDEKGINFDENKVGDYIFGINGVRKCKKQKN